MNQIFSSHQDPDIQARDTSTVPFDPQRGTSLCARCYRIFLDPNISRKLIEEGEQLPYQIEHYTTSELKKYTKKGCTLCSKLFHTTSSGDEQDIPSFFNICRNYTTGLRSEIEWHQGTSDGGYQQISFYYFAEPESPMSTIIQSRPMLKSVTNKQAILRIEQAFNHCRMCHEACSRDSMSLLPTRVIDVNQMCLYESKTAEIGMYIALSYCWGGDQKVKTTSKNITSKKNGIILAELPQTLQDAVQVCTKLKIQYLWIDALCIIQDDDNDKAKEISRMAVIYNRATFVISASRARSVYDGFLAEIKDYSQEIIKLPCRFSNAWEGTLSIIEVPRESSGLEPINERGWCFQEISLASRALIYTEGGIIWQCKTIFDRLAFDGIQIGHHPSEDLVVATSEFKAGIVQRVEWDQLVRTYTLRNLTNPNDRLEALAGIAMIASSLWNNKYYAGLWEYDMKSQLGWRLDYSDLERDWTSQRLEAPSWSWASVTGPVCQVFSFDRTETDGGARVISCEVKAAHPENAFGRVISGQLTIEGFLVEAKYADPSWLDDTCMDITSEFNVEEVYDGMWCLLLGYTYTNGALTTEGTPQWEGLLLRRLHDGKFERAGHFMQDLGSEFWSDDEESIEKHFTESESRQSIGLEAKFPAEGARKIVVLV